VLRQPFGGMGKSSVGPGIKAGGPNYVAPLMQFDSTNDDRSNPTDRRSDLGDTGLDDFCELLRMAAARGQVAGEQAETIVAAVQSYEYWMAEEFDRSHDHFLLLGEDNIRRYLPLREVRVRVHADDSVFELFARAAAARSAGCRTVVSSPPELRSPWVKLLDESTDDWAAAIEFVEESDTELAQLVREGHVDRIRYARAERVPLTLRTASALDGQYIADTPVCANGRVELLWYFHEQSLSHVYHRYGNLGIRADEKREE
jgi:RHH-type proline utilization regulon transcriptional repressor/proline dehydrogenase/delta 1-pyrroline-5-carboxylate dehydrogenase